MKLRANVLALSALFFCASGLSAVADEHAAPGGGAGLASLDGNWQLVEIGGRAAPERVTLALANGSFSGRGGCNRYFGAAQAGDAPGALQFGAIGATRMSCGEAIDGREMTYFAALAEVTRFVLAPAAGAEPARLMLRYGQSMPMRELVFKRIPEE